jgi:hypothetical protein
MNPEQYQNDMSIDSQDRLTRDAEYKLGHDVKVGRADTDWPMRTSEMPNFLEDGLIIPSSRALGGKFSGTMCIPRHGTSLAR